MSQESNKQESHGRVVVPQEPSFSRRVATSVVKMAHRFQSDILFAFGDIQINAKSTLMAYILLDALKGKMLELTAHGPDSALAVRVLSGVFAGKL
jgi:phosphotransferase system HPr (HPr) family protein